MATQDTVQVLKDHPAQVSAFGSNGTTPQTAATVAAATAAPAAITAIAPPAGGTGATAGAYDTAGNRNLAIAAITANQVDIAALRTTLALVVTLQNQIRAALVANGIAV